MALWALGTLAKRLGYLSRPLWELLGPPGRLQRPLGRVLGPPGRLVEVAQTTLEASWPLLRALRQPLRPLGTALETSRTALEASKGAVQDRPGRQASKTMIWSTHFGSQNGPENGPQNETGDFVKIVFPPRRQYDF